MVVALAAAATAAAGAAPAVAQLLPPLFPPSTQSAGQPTDTTTDPSTTQTTQPPPPPTTAPPATLLPPLFPPPTTAPPSTTDTTAPPGGDPAPPTTGSPLPPAPDPCEGEGGPAGPTGPIPAAAQAVIDAIARTGPANNAALVDGAALLEQAGVPHDEAVRAVFGRFPIQGPSHWSDDWYFPRWTGSTFRHHQGLDMFAAYGTPVAAPVDGIARVGSNALGGLTVQVHEPDGTYWYLAHLSGIAPGLVDGQAVTAGQVVGYVGDSGNARGGAPHLHFGLYPQGGPAAPPKPVVDAWVVEGAARVPDLLASLGSASTTTPVPTEIARRPAVDVGPTDPLGPSQGELLWATSANPAGGAVRVADAAAAAAGSRIDWTRRAAEQRALDLAWQRSSDAAQQLLAPLTNGVLRRAVEALRAR